MPKLILISLVLISLCSLVFASDWKREVNGRWGFALTYPASLIPKQSPVTALVGAITQQTTKSR